MNVASVILDSLVAMICDSSEEVHQAPLFAAQSGSANVFMQSQHFGMLEALGVSYFNFIQAGHHCGTHLFGGEYQSFGLF